jgi:hypothetical protein
MLTKLLKYEFKSTYPKFLSAFAVYVIMVGVLLVFFGDNTALTIGLISVGIVALWVMMIVNIVQRYNANLYGNEGYLMFSLPVSGRKLLLSKIISALVWIVGLGVISSTSALVVTYCYGDTPSINNAISEIIAQLGNVVPELAEAAVVIILTVVSIFLAITVSKLPVWRKFGVLMGFITYFAAYTIRLIPSFFFKAADSGLSLSSRTSVITPTIFTMPVQNVGAVVWVQLCYDILLCVGIFFAITWLMDKKTSLK